MAWLSRSYKRSVVDVETTSFEVLYMRDHRPARFVVAATARATLAISENAPVKSGNSFYPM